MATTPTVVLPKETDPANQGATVAPARTPQTSRLDYASLPLPDIIIRRFDMGSKFSQQGVTITPAPTVVAPDVPIWGVVATYISTMQGPPLFFNFATDRKDFRFPLTVGWPIRFDRPATKGLTLTVGNPTGLTPVGSGFNAAGAIQIPVGTYVTIAVATSKEAADFLSYPSVFDPWFNSAGYLATQTKAGDATHFPIIFWANGGNGVDRVAGRLNTIYIQSSAAGTVLLQFFGFGATLPAAIPFVFAGKREGFFIEAPAFGCFGDISTTQAAGGAGATTPATIAAQTYRTIPVPAAGPGVAPVQVNLGQELTNVLNSDGAGATKGFGFAVAGTAVNTTLTVDYDWQERLEIEP